MVFPIYGEIDIILQKERGKREAKPLVNWILHNGINLVDCHINYAVECKLITTSIWFLKKKEKEEKEDKKGIFFPSSDCPYILKYFLFLPYMVRWVLW